MKNVKSTYPTPQGYLMCYFDDGTYQLEHRYVMELHLGRPLLHNERVSHIDQNRTNNNLSNLRLRSNPNQPTTPSKDPKGIRTTLPDNYGYLRHYFNDGTWKQVHRYIMELHLNRPLSHEEIVHHVDGNKLNNDLSNLELLSRSEHQTLHRTGQQASQTTRNRMKTAQRDRRRRERIQKQQNEKY